jgi:hypothetical protein
MMGSCGGQSLTGGPRDRTHSGYSRLRNMRFPCEALTVQYATALWQKTAREHLPPLHRPSSVPSAARPKQHQIAGSNSVIATQLAKHLDLSRQRVQQLVDEHVITQLPNGKFDQDACRIAYLRCIPPPKAALRKTG